MSRVPFRAGNADAEGRGDSTRPAPSLEETSTDDVQMSLADAL